MNRIEVQGIVSVQNGQPIVQFRHLEDGELVVGWQVGPHEAREMAQQIQEAATNAVYDAAIMLWASETWPDDPVMGARMLQMIRTHRADAWGLPDQPDDWTKGSEREEQ